MQAHARLTDDREDRLHSADTVVVAPVEIAPAKPAGRWRRMLDALYAGRMATAQREIERRQDLIARWRRGLVQRKEHLLVVPTPRATPPSSWLQTLGERVGAAMAGGHAIIAQWRRRIRLRNELATLSDGDLADLRWTRAEVDAERRKPFWRA
jgi:uncharacterized protein YjiS (DUF1127 family)